jgi:hypothetical protein
VHAGSDLRSLKHQPTGTDSLNGLLTLNSGG